MEGIKSSVVLFALLLAIFGPTGSFGNRRTCFCETWGHPSDESSSDSTDTWLSDIQNRVYTGWPHLGCSSPKTRCPRDCKQDALQTLGGSGSRFTEDAGNRVCRIYGEDKPCPGISVVAKYVVSSCGKRGTLRLASSVCCAVRRFKCSCNLMASVEGRLHYSLPLTPYIGAYQGPYYDCNDEERINSDCKDACINHYRRTLGGSISPSYDVDSSEALCIRLRPTTLPTGAVLISYSAQVNIRYSSGVGDPKTEELEKLCCITVPSLSLTAAVPVC